MLSLLLAAPAFADFPEQVSLTAMDDWQGVSTRPASSDPTVDWVQDAYKQLVRELGTSIANKPFAPAESLGQDGFHVGVAGTVAFIDTQKDAEGNPSGWALADPDEDPSPVEFIPWIEVRKGLPLSFEVGANFGWLAGTQTAALGAYGRWVPIEGWKFLPDVALQAGYSAYVGNDELEVGVIDLSATLGYTLAFGTTPGVHQASFAPYVGIGLNRIHGAPRADLSRTELDGRLVEVGGEDNADTTFDPLQLSGGFRILNGDFTATICGTWSPDILPTASIGFGYTF